MLNKFSANRSLPPLIIMTVFFALYGNAQSAMTERLSSPQYYANAAANLPKGTILTKSNTKMTAESESNRIPRGAMWLTDPNDAYGFALERTVDRGGIIGGHDLKVSSNDLTPKPDDQLWKKYAKSSIVCDKRLDFPTSQRYDQGALAELVKMGAKKQRLVRMDDHDLIFYMLQHSKEHDAEMKLSSDESKALVARLKDRQPFDLRNADAQVKKYEAEKAQIEAKILNKAKTHLARAQAVYTAVAGVLPPGSQVVRYQKDELADAQKRYAEVVKN